VVMIVMLFMTAYWWCCLWCRDIYLDSATNRAVVAIQRLIHALGQAIISYCWGTSCAPDASVPLLVYLAIVSSNSEELL